MALFKPLLGKRENLPTNLTNGYAYFCTDDGSFWIDYIDSDSVLKRKQINAQEAEKLIGYDIATVISNDDTAIPVSSAVFSAIEAATEVYVGPDMPTDPNIKVWVNTAENGSSNSIEIDDTLTKAGKAADAKATGDAINKVQTNTDDAIRGINENKVDISDIVDNLETTTEGKVLSANQGNVLKNQIDEISKTLANFMYEDIAISSFVISSLTSSGTGGTFTKSPVELGTTVTSVTLSWNTNRTPSALTLNGSSIDVFADSYTYNNLNLISNKTYTLKATGEKDEVVTKTTTLTFCNRVCYGVAEMPDVVDSDFVMSLETKVLATSKTNNGIKYNAGNGQYLWYCVPVRLGECSFTDTETQLAAGLSLVSTVNVTNASGYAEDYYVYKSDYAGLGSLTVKVS